MKAIWKYPLEVTDVQTIEVPAGARTLDVQMQDGPCLWMLADPEMPRVSCEVRVAGTGHPRDDLMYDDYAGTFQMLGGSLVFHVFVAPALPHA